MSCGECRWFFPLEDDPATGDCVRRDSDEKSEYWTARPVSAERSSEDCRDFEGRS